MRPRNEDAVVADVTRGLFAVIDGMGGHGNGELAAAILADRLGCVLPWHGVEAAAAMVSEALHGANRAIRARAEAEGLGSFGATVVCLVVEEGSTAVIWAGDSRAYHFDGSRLTRLSRDHSLVGDLVAEGRLSEEEAARHPHANVVTRAIGVTEAPEPDCRIAPARTDGYYLLCSDGLTGAVSDERIARVLSMAVSPSDAADGLIAAALAARTSDNVSVVVVSLGAT
ncbi:MAG: protein phosphatase 2C domain-containing protein [Pseudomonadota bacterium]